MTGGIAGVIGLGLAVPLAAYFISPAFVRRKKSWVSVGKVEDLPVGTPKALDYSMTIKDGWMETKAVKAVWAIRQPDNQVTVFSPICRHLIMPMTRSNTFNTTCGLAGLCAGSITGEHPRS